MNNFEEIEVVRRELYTISEQPSGNVSEENPVFYSTSNDMQQNEKALSHFHNALLGIHYLNSINLSQFKYAEYARAIELIEMIESSLKGMINTDSKKMPPFIKDHLDSINKTDFLKKLPRSLKRAANRLNATAKLAAGEDSKKLESIIKKNKPTIFERIFKAFIRFIDKHSKKGPKKEAIYEANHNINKSYEKFHDELSQETASVDTEENSASSSNENIKKSLGKPANKNKTQIEDSTSKPEKSKVSKTEPSITSQLAKPSTTTSSSKDGSQAVQPLSSTTSTDALKKQSEKTNNQPAAQPPTDMLTQFDAKIFSQIFKNLTPTAAGRFAQTSKASQKAVEKYYLEFISATPFELPPEGSYRNRVLRGLFQKAIHNNNTQLLRYVVGHMKEATSQRLLNQALEEAIRANNIASVQFLLKVNDPNTKLPYIDVNSEIVEINSNEPMAPRKPLHLAATLGFHEIMDLCVEQGALIKSSGRTELHYAIRGENAECVKIIMSMVDNKKFSDPSKINKTELLNKYRYTFVQLLVLSEAINYGNLEIVRVLLDHGCDPNNVNAGIPSLIEATQHDKPEIVELLLEHKATMDIRAENNMGYLINFVHNSRCIEILLEKLCQNDDDKILLGNILLLQALKDNDDLTQAQVQKRHIQDDFCTPLHLFAKYSYESDKTLTEFEKIIQNCRALELNIDKQDTDGNTALHLAAHANKKRLVLALMEAGATINIPNKEHKTPSEMSDDQQIKDLFTTGPKLE